MKATRPVAIFGGPGRGFAYLGDKTSHGGVIVRATGGLPWEGIRNARVGDWVYCPKCKPHLFKIATGLETFDDHGAFAARDQDLTECGARLLAEQASTEELMAARAIAFAEEYVFDEQIAAVDSYTNAPHPHVAYYVEAEDGTSFSGYTDQDGNCPRIGTASQLDLRVWFGLAAELKMERKK